MHLAAPSLPQQPLSFDSGSRTLKQNGQTTPEGITKF